MNTRILIIFPLIASGVFSSCSGSSNSVPGAVPAAKATNTLAGTPESSPNGSGQGCSRPAVFAQGNAQSIDVAKLSKMSGTLHLSLVSLYSQTKDTQGAVVNSFSEGAAIKVNPNGLRDTKIQNICNQSSANPYTETLPVVMTLHLPSLRVTEFDVNDENAHSTTNNPTYANFIADSLGNLSFKMNFSDKGPPYSTELTLTDWMKKLPAQPSIAALSDGSIEMRIHWSEKATSTDAYLHFE